MLKDELLTIKNTKKTDFLKRLTKMQHFDKVKVVRLTEINEIWTSFSQ